MPGAVSRYPHFVIVVLVGSSGNPADLCFKVPSSKLGSHTRHPDSSFSWLSSFPSDEYRRSALITPRSLGLLHFGIYHSVTYSAIHTAFLNSPQTTLFNDPWTVCNYYINFVFKGRYLGLVLKKKSGHVSYGTFCVITGDVSWNASVPPYCWNGPWWPCDHNLLLPYILSTRL